MSRITTFLGMLAIVATLPVMAFAANEQLRRTVASELSTFAPEVDIDGLTDAQVIQLHHILYGNYGTGTKQAMIRSTLGDCLPILCRLRIGG